MTYLGLAKRIVFGLPLFTYAACNHHTGMQLPRTDAGPDSGRAADLGKGEDLATDSPAPDALVVDFGSGEVDSAPDVGWAIDLGKGDDVAPDAPARDVDWAVDLGKGDDIAPDAPVPDVPALDGPSPPMLVIDPASADSRVMFVGDKPRSVEPATFTLQNGGGTATGLLQVALAGPNAAFWKIVDDKCTGASLAAHGSCTVGASWAPISYSVGPWTGLLVATDTASGESVTAALNGVPMLGHCMRVYEYSADLGSVLPGATGAEVRVTVMNYCDFDLGTISKAVMGPNSDMVRISTNTCTTTLAPKGICVIGVQLAPPSDAEPATLFATMRVFASEDGGVGTVSLTGTILANPSLGQDASADGAQGNVDPAQDAGTVLFPEIAGHTFQIAARNTPPDASAGLGTACRAPDEGATYDLSFSADRTKVHVVRMDSVPEATLDGTLAEQTDTTLRYTINTGLGGELLIWKESDSLVARFDLYGSGVPVVLCIQSPMTEV